MRQALAESRNAVAVWITAQIGIGRVLRTSRSLGIRTPLQPYPTTALGASEINLLELANAYRTMASGIVAEPYVIRAVLRDFARPLGHPFDSDPASVEESAAADQQHHEDDDEQSVRVHFLSLVFRERPRGQARANFNV